jgi:omega-amidase
LVKYSKPEIENKKKHRKAQFSGLSLLLKLIAKGSHDSRKAFRTTNTDTMQDLHIALIQAPLLWENKQGNLDRFEQHILGLHHSQDLILLPEMFSTGFSMEPEKLAEDPDGETVQWMMRMASASESVIAGTLMVADGGNYYNRSVWATPEGEVHYYDKRHLFTMGSEDRHFSPGGKRVVIHLKGWKIVPLTCYDLRFPVWSRNQYRENEYTYDLLCYLANWPAARSHHWRQLLIARAIENQAFVAGVNRTGRDGKGLNHNGHSIVVDAFGNLIADAGEQDTAVVVATLKGDQLDDYRKRFFVAADWNNELCL